MRLVLLYALPRPSDAGLCLFGQGPPMQLMVRLPWHLHCTTEHEQHVSVAAAWHQAICSQARLPQVHPL